MTNSLIMVNIFVLFTITNEFHVVTLKKTWRDADEYCQTAYGTHLITITDSTMNQNIFNAIPSDIIAWIGYNDAYNEGKWEWIGYNQSSYTNWYSGQPDNHQDREDCGMIRKSVWGSKWNDAPCSSLQTFVCAEPADYPTKTPTLMPSNNPASSLSEYSTEVPISSWALNKMAWINNGSSCSNLADHYDLIYEINLNECIDICQNMDELCRMINYYYYFKSQNDSRCYVFDDICNVVSNNNYNVDQTIAYYKMYASSCTDYPHNWIDNIGDNCQIYSTYNWCDNGLIVKNQNDFYELIDNKYDLTAIDTCCECGGGINIVNNVTFSVDQYWFHHEDDILCSFTPQLFEERKTSLRNWDNLILYQLCDYLNDINCAFLIHSQFDSNTYSYSIYLCNHTQFVENEFEFIIYHKINIESSTHDIYVNLLWFDIDSSYYSTNINIVYSNYSQCIQDIINDNDINDTYKYGIHPCYTLDTFSPSVNPTHNLTDNPLEIPTSYFSTYVTYTPSISSLDVADSKNEESESLINISSYALIIICVLSSCLFIMIAVILIMWRKSNKQSADQVDAIPHKIEMTPYNDTVGEINTNGTRKPSALLSEDPSSERNIYCIICCDNNANIFNDPCGHVTYCNNCVDHLQITQQDDKCPNCRQTIAKYKQIYQAGFVSN